MIFSIIYRLNDIKIEKIKNLDPINKIWWKRSCILKNIDLLLFLGFILNRKGKQLVPYHKADVVRG